MVSLPVMTETSVDDSLRSGNVGKIHFLTNGTTNMQHEYKTTIDIHKSNFVKDNGWPILMSGEL